MGKEQEVPFPKSQSIDFVQVVERRLIGLSSSVIQWAVALEKLYIVGRANGEKYGRIE